MHGLKAAGRDRGFFDEQRDSRGPLVKVADRWEWCRGSRSVLVLATLAVSMIGGCQQGPRRYALSGRVALDGQPLADGAISFRPEEGTPGPSAGGEIKDGVFSIPASGGGDGR